MAHPPRALPAAALAGIVSATVIPIDRPGFGWLLAGTVVAGTLYAVDHHARTRPAVPTATAPADGEPTTAAPAVPGPLTGGSAPGADGEPSARTAAPAADAAPGPREGLVPSTQAGIAPSAQPSTTSGSSVTTPAPAADATTGHRADAVSPDRAQADPAAAPSLPAEAGVAAVRQGASSTGATGTGAADDAPAARGSTPPSTASSTDMPARTGGSSTEDPNGRTIAAAPAPTSTNTPLPECDPRAPADRGGAAARPSPAATHTPPPSSADPQDTGERRGAGGVPSLASGNTPPTRSDDPQHPVGHRSTRLPGSARVWWAAAALVLLGVGTVRAAGWLFALCVVAACVAGSLAVLGRRTRWGVVHDMVAVPLATLDALPWAWSGLREARPKGASSVRRYGVSVAATVALLVVFVPLLGGADATFADLLSGLVPAVDGASAWHWILLFGVVGIGALAALYLLAGPPAAAEEGSRPARQWSRSEWVLPVSALTVLFGVFVGAQFVALFGGDDYVQRTAGLTYAEYARSGFWQLSAVSILTLAVILAVLHWSEQDSAADRRWLRVLLTAVSVLSLVIVGSALARMWTYQQAYGFTVLRVLVGVCELWVGLVYLLVLVAVALLRWTWVSRAAVGTALGTLIALAVLNPEHLVAERNIDRWEQGKRLDTGYLSTLSPDIVPALTRLPESLRTQIEDPILADLDEDSWWSWNWSRESAR
ncbi:DUF4153 domain-containing protein [Nocardia neocaledoniensis]|uniref:DUF4153 domain-containing protein n=3 Tax=Nocardia neocaledoniensis TaxID=236511 RepID=UPI001FC8F605|nr:DUF4173 domain-containing protein [Nocardia neocaledoniensis]